MHCVLFLTIMLSSFQADDSIEADFFSVEVPIDNAIGLTNCKMIGTIENDSRRGAIFERLKSLNGKAVFPFFTGVLNLDEYSGLRNDIFLLQIEPMIENDLFYPQYVIVDARLNQKAFPVAIPIRRNPGLLKRLGSKIEDEVPVDLSGKKIKFIVRSCEPIDLHAQRRSSKAALQR